MSAVAAYYNDVDPFVCAWVKELIKEGLVPAGEVDERSIRDVQASDLKGFTQCHFFCGIAGWAYALRLAGWPDSRECWTGSAPCQPFSQAGGRKGGADDRHLWPDWARLIRECRPVAIFGEQVESAIAHGWLDAVFDELEGLAYACGAACVPAASVAAPHIRQRLWFVAHAERGTAERYRQQMGRTPRGLEITAPERQRVRDDSRNGGDIDALDDTERQRAERVARREGRQECAPSSDGQDEGCRVIQAQHASVIGDMDDAEGSRLSISNWTRKTRLTRSESSSFWGDSIWLECRDEKARPAQSEIFPLAAGLPNRVGILRGAGNSIVPQVAAEVISAYMALER